MTKEDLMNSEHTHNLRYLAGYSDDVVTKVDALVKSNRLGEVLLKKYPVAHDVKTDRALYDYAMELKNRYLKKSQPVTRVAYDPKISDLNNALGLHAFVSRVQGGKLKAKNEIKVASVFRDAPLDFLRMIVVHELAHLKEKDHNKAFYSLCDYMEPDYHQLEFDTRLYLTQLELAGPLY